VTTAEATPPMPTAPSPRRVQTSTHARGRAAAALAAPSVALALWGARAAWAGPGLDFLLWNLFLAAVPWAAAQLFAAVRGRAALAVTGVVWLLFLPNAPYLLTDLIHLRPRHGVPHWFDALLFGAFALAGCVLGWASLERVHLRVARSAGRLRAAAAVALALFLTGFGVYLGRFLRWNSWDVVARPRALLVEASAALASPRALAFSVAFAAVIGAGYLVFSPPRLRLPRA
jgi:uncharacterized membrane protein